jgi:Domain of unknown function (DUF4337)
MPEVEIPNPEELEEIRNKGFTRRVAITTAIYAVMLAIAALGGNNAMKDMLLAQQQSSDQWAFYQAKVIREHEYRIQQKRLEVELAERGTGMAPEARQQYEALLAEFTAETKRYNTEKKDVEKDAKKLEHERDVVGVDFVELTPDVWPQPDSRARWHLPHAQRLHPLGHAAVLPRWALKRRVR